MGTGQVFLALVHEPGSPSPLPCGIGHCPMCVLINWKWCKHSRGCTCVTSCWCRCTGDSAWPQLEVTGACRPQAELSEKWGGHIHNSPVWAKSSLNFGLGLCPSLQYRGVIFHIHKHKGRYTFHTQSKRKEVRICKVWKSVRKLRVLSSELLVLVFVKTWYGLAGKHCICSFAQGLLVQEHKCCYMHCSQSCVLLWDMAGWWQCCW